MIGDLRKKLLLYGLAGGALGATTPLFYYYKKIKDAKTKEEKNKLKKDLLKATLGMGIGGAALSTGIGKLVEINRINNNVDQNTLKFVHEHPHITKKIWGIPNFHIEVARENNMFDPNIIKYKARGGTLSDILIPSLAVVGLSQFKLKDSNKKEKKK